MALLVTGQTKHNTESACNVHASQWNVQACCTLFRQALCFIVSSINFILVDLYISLFSRPSFKLLVYMYILQYGNKCHVELNIPGAIDAEAAGARSYPGEN